VTTTAQQRAVVEALGLSPRQLRELADVAECAASTVLVREVAERQIADLPRGHLYVTSLRRLVRWAGDDDATAVQAADIGRWAQRARQEAFGRPNARHGLGAQEAFVLAARAAYGQALAAGVVRENPAASVDLPARPPGPRTALSSEQLRQAHVSLIAGSRNPQLDDLVFAFLRETAARRGGVIRLERRDVTAAARTVHLVEKYGRERWQPISAHLVAGLHAHTDTSSCACGRLFHRADGGHLSDRWFDGFAQRLQRRSWARELGVSAHWVRHTTLTDIERLAGLRVAGAFAGHSDTRFGVTGGYTKASLDELRTAHARLFFDRPRNAEDPHVAPELFRRVVPAAAGPVEFAVA
jgi:integrase